MLNETFSVTFKHRDQGDVVLSNCECVLDDEKTEFEDKLEETGNVVPDPNEKWFWIESFFDVQELYSGTSLSSTPNPQHPSPLSAQQSIR